MAGVWKKGLTPISLSWTRDTVCQLQSTKNLTSRRRAENRQGVLRGTTTSMAKDGSNTDGIEWDGEENSHDLRSLFLFLHLDLLLHSRRSFNDNLPKRSNL